MLLIINKTAIPILLISAPAGTE